MDDRELIQQILIHYLGRPLGAAKRGDMMDAYRKLALAMNVEESTPRMWLARGKVPRHAKARIQALLEGRDPDVEDPDGAVTEDLTEFAPAVLTMLRDIQRIHDLTKGRGEVWRSLAATITLAKTWARHGSPNGLRHLRPMHRD